MSQSLSIFHGGVYDALVLCFEILVQSERIDGHTMRHMPVRFLQDLVPAQHKHAVFVDGERLKAVYITLPLFTILAQNVPKPYDRLQNIDYQRQIVIGIGCQVCRRRVVVYFGGA